MKTGTVLVLLVEDDPRTWVPMSLLLMNEFSFEIDRPVDVLLAESLEKAEQLAREHLSTIDAILMDGVIVGGTTFNLIRLIRELGFRGPMVTFSGEERTFIDRMMAAGCDVRLRKPIDSQDLFRVLKARLNAPTVQAEPPVLQPSSSLV
ncbi:MAG: hypothetical protein Q7N87_00635 [Candidatus Uhrbacteria bacterium]|nr:hypothetical protein [Candidatus Uhrbacteria bacterium]